MTTESCALPGKYVCLEPLEHRHADGLVAAAADDTSLYQWSPVPCGKVEVASERPHTQVTSGSAI